MNLLSLVRKRRALLNSRFDIVRQFGEIEESCVAAYAHKNPVVASIFWWRLASAVRAYHRYAPGGTILDFGAASGELFHVLQPSDPYHFIELEDQMAETLLHFNPAANRQSIESLGPGSYSAIFALDSLEHNNNIPELLATFHEALADDGVLILSGPTENFLYRFGRRLASWSGHCHMTNIYDIERMSNVLYSRITRTAIPTRLTPLFSVTAWRKKA